MQLEDAIRSRKSIRAFRPDAVPLSSAFWRFCKRLPARHRLGALCLLAIEKGNREKSRRQHRRNYPFLDAPVGLFFTSDAYLGRGSWSDLGLYMQTRDAGGPGRRAA